MITKYKNRRIESIGYNVLTFAYCINSKGEKVGQTMVESKFGHTMAINKMKKLIDRAIHYNEN